MLRPKQVYDLQKVQQSYDMVWAGMLAAHLALKSNRQSIRIEEYFGGVYLIDRDALLPYWLEGSRLDSFVRRVCGLTDPVWFYWIDSHETLRTKFAEGILISFSKELAAILNYAARLALKIDGKSIPKKRPELDVNHFMAALAHHRSLRFTHSLMRAGIKLQKFQMVQHDTASARDGSENPSKGILLKRHFS